MGFLPEVHESGAPSSSGAPSTSMPPSSSPPSASMAPSSTLGPAPVWETSAPTVEAPVWETQAPIAEAPVWETLAPVVEAPVWETEAPGWDDCPEAECIVWDVSIDDSKSTYRLPGHADTYFLVEPFSVIDNSCEDSGFSDLRRIQFNATVTARVELDCYVGGSIAVLEGCEQNIVTVNVTQEACITNDENDDVIANGTRQVFEFLATENVAYFLNFSNVTVDSSSLECPVAECLHFYSALDGWNTFLQPGTNDSYITVEPGLPIDFDCPDSGSSNNDTLGRLQFFTSTFATIELDCCTEGTITVTEGCEQAEVDVNVMEEVCTVTNENGAAIASGTRQVFEFAAKGDVPYFVDFSSVTTDSCTTCPAAECIDYANAVDGWNGFLIPGTFDAFFHVVPDLPFDFGCPDSGSSDTLGRLEFFLSEIVTIELDCCTEGNIIVTEGCEQADVRVEATEHNCVATDDLNNLIGDEPKRKFEFFARENVPYFVDFGSVDTAICNSEPA